MRIIIAGSRTIEDEHTVKAALLKAIKEWQPRVITEIVTGGASGVDAIGKKIAEDYGVAHREFPADWDQHGKRAGYLRNVQMAEYADALMLVWDGSSRGSKMMLDIARDRGLRIQEVVV